VRNCPICIGDKCCCILKKKIVENQTLEEVTFVCSVHHQVSAINGILEHLLLLEEDALGGSIMPQELIARVIVTNSIFCVSWPLYLILVLTLFKVGTFKIPVNGGLDSKCGVRFDVGRCIGVSMVTAQKILS